MKRKFVLLLLVIGLTIIAEAQAQTARTLDLARMQRDVEIMEMVLDRLLNRQSHQFMRIGGGSARGMYVPNFGVLFQIPNSSSVISIAEMRERAERAVVEKRAATGRGGNAVSPTAATEENVSEELWEFFSRYADAIGQLSDSDRIAVYSEGGSEFSFVFEISGERASGFSSQPHNFFAWMTKGDLAALRAGKLSENDFRERMRTMKLAEDNPDIEIMSGILDKLTGNRSGAAHGFYVQDYGAIFFAETDFTDEISQSVWSTRRRGAETISNTRPETYRQIEDALRAARTAEQERTRTWQEDYKKFRAKIAEALADYGHTLRTLKPDDWLVVTTDFRFAPPEQPRGLVCQIKKQQLEAYSTGKISREQLLKSFAYFEN